MLSLSLYKYNQQVGKDWAPAHMFFKEQKIQTAYMLHI